MLILSNEMITTDRTVRIRGERWAAIEKMALEFSFKKQKLIKGTDVADALIYKSLKNLTLEEFEKIMEER